MTSTSFSTGRLLLRITLVSAAVSILAFAHIRSGVAGHNTVSNPYYDASYRDEDILKACTDFRTKSYGQVFARCNDNGNHTWKASIDLDNLVGNVDGDLTWGETNYSDTCRKRKDVRFTNSGVYFAMECEELPDNYNSEADWKETEINLRSGLKNVGGRFRAK